MLELEGEPFALELGRLFVGDDVQGLVQDFEQFRVVLANRHGQGHGVLGRSGDFEGGYSLPLDTVAARGQVVDEPVHLAQGQGLEGLVDVGKEGQVKLRMIGDQVIVRRVPFDHADPAVGDTSASPLTRGASLGEKMTMGNSM